MFLVWTSFAKGSEVGAQLLKDAAFEERNQWIGVSFATRFPFFLGRTIIETVFSNMYFDLAWELLRFFQSNCLHGINEGIVVIKKTELMQITKLQVCQTDEI